MWSPVEGCKLCSGLEDYNDEDIVLAHLAMIAVEEFGREGASQEELEERVRELLASGMGWETMHTRLSVSCPEVMS
jgi:hypothetical protein